MQPLLVWIAVAGALFAQQTRREIVNPSPPPADDARPNSNRVPAAYATPDRIQRVVIFRFKSDAERLAGMDRLVKQEQIRNGVILCGVGSLKGYQVHQVCNRTF